MSSLHAYRVAGGADCAALGSAFGQNPTPVQVMLGVDHNPDSAARARREFLQSHGAGERRYSRTVSARKRERRASTQPIYALEERPFLFFSPNNTIN
jgi:hypothetical protein